MPKGSPGIMLGEFLVSQGFRDKLRLEGQNSGSVLSVKGIWIITVYDAQFHICKRETVKKIKVKEHCLCV